jgi:gliding motility-associated-like protein
VGSISWNFGDGEESSGGNSVSHIYTTSGVYNVTLSIVTPDGCAFDTLALDAITIYPVPNPFFIMNNPITTLQNTTIEFDNQTIGATSYYWVFDTINNLGESSDENPIYVFPDQLPDEYYVKLYAYNDFGCESSIMQTLVVNEDLTIYVPNSFSPNGDGKNDFFYVKGMALDPSVFSLIIFDRWGKKVFETNDINERWNGSVKGSDYYAQPGVFVYFLSYKSNSTTDKKETQGSITLLK